MEDAREWDEESRRRNQFVQWLLKAWSMAVDIRHPIAETLAELISHADEMDYPIWHVAAQKGVIGDGRTATMLRHACGVPVIGSTATGWEKWINYAPVIYLDEPVWRAIHGQLGWVNRDHDDNIPNSFWLWSNAANQIRFVMRKQGEV